MACARTTGTSAPQYVRGSPSQRTLSRIRTFRNRPRLPFREQLVFSRQENPSNAASLFAVPDINLAYLYLTLLQLGRPSDVHFSGNIPQSFGTKGSFPAAGRYYFVLERESSRTGECCVVEQIGVGEEVVLGMGWFLKSRIRHPGLLQDMQETW